MPQILVKQPSESRLYKMRFTGLLPDLAAGEVITGITSLVATAGITVSGSSFSDTYVQFRAAGGTAGVVYTVTAVVTTSFGNTVEGEMLIHVKAI